MTRYRTPELKRRHADEEAARRAKRVDDGICKSCLEPVAVRENGMPYGSCPVHLRLDRERKAREKQREEQQ